MSPSDWHSSLLSLEYGDGDKKPRTPCDIDMTKPGFFLCVFILLPYRALIQKFEALVKENIVVCVSGGVGGLLVA